MVTVTRDVGTLIRDNADEIVGSALAREERRWPDLFASFTAEQLAHTRVDTRSHVEFLASALWAEEPALFTEYVRWAKGLFAGLGLPIEWLEGSLVDAGKGAVDVLGDEARPAQSLIDGAVTALESLDASVPSYMDTDGSLSGLAVRYLGALLGADRHGASEMIHEAAAGGVDIAQIYTQVFQPTQLELGRLWQANLITVAQEHYATAVTQLVMSRLYEYIFSAEKNGRRLVAACIGDELHEMGMRMVADFFEMAHWDTDYLGANTPASEIIEAATTGRADLIALSATMSPHIPAIERTISAIRSDPRTAEVKIIVGGYPFNVAPGLWERVGADGCAPDAPAAIALADRLVTT